MRNFGVLMLIVGIAGFLYCSDRASKAGSVPEGKSISESLEYDAGKWEVARYACGAAAMFGLLTIMVAKDR
jgi:hypothetical protein